MSLSAILRLSGIRVFVLHAFMDDTASQHYEPNIFGVGGFLFSPDGLRAFDAEWVPLVADLPKPYRTALCAAGRYPFVPPEWPYEARRNLMNNLAQLAARTRDAGVVAFTHSDEYNEYAAREPNIAQYAGSPNALCLMACMDAIAAYMGDNYPGEDVIYWIESGSSNEPQMSDFLRRINANEKTRQRFKLRGYGFYPKASAPALCAADFLCWQWQRNYVEAHNDNDTGQWLEGFRLLFQNENAKPIIPVKLGSVGIGIRAMVHRFYNLHRD